jgi:predicted ATPase/DNA-binding SARP family transcriptional activator
VDFRILGSLEVDSGEGPITIGARKQRTLLGSLLLTPNRLVTIDALIDDLWPDGDAPGGAPATVRVYVSYLRKLVGPDVIVTKGPGYVAHVAPGQLDALRFEQAVGVATEAALRGDFEMAAAGFAAALAEWRGDVLADLALSSADHPDIARLDELRMVATEQRIDAELACGRHAVVVAELEQLVVAHPLRERFWAQRMLALYRGGRQADALRAYQELRGVLVEELGVEPSAEVRTLEAAILRQDASVDWHPAEVAVPRAAPPAEFPTGVVTFLLTDVEGSTALWEHDAAPMAAAMIRHHDIVAEVTTRHGGVRVASQGEGDSAFCVFASAADAVRSALDLQRALKAITESPRLRVRMGLHTGEAELRNNDYSGPAVNRTARVRGLGHGGQILMSEVTVRALRSEVPDGGRVRDMGRFRLKGVPGTHRVFQFIHPDLDDDFPPLVGSPAARHNLPAAVANFVGRSDEHAEILSALAQHRVVTVTGTGGAGKTRLALAVGSALVDSFEAGVWFADLSARRDGAGVPGVLANALGVREQPSEPLMTTVAEHVGNRGVLLIVDNCEHVLTAAATATTDFVRSCPNARVLATSREPLRIDGEIVVPLAPLPLTDAAELFLDRAAAADARFVPHAADASVVDEICRRLDSLPLAIELAAARVRTMPLATLAARLDDRFRLLTRGRRDAAARHETLAAVVEWSHELLTDRERELFAVLSQFVGGFTLDAVEAVAGDALDDLAQLVDKSLIVTDYMALDRFGMLETIRVFAADRFAATAEPTVLRSREAFARWCVDLARRGDVGILGAEQEQWLHTLDAEHANLRAALQWSLEHDLETAIALAGSLWRFWDAHGHWREGRHWLETVIAAAGDRVSGDVLAGAGRLAECMGDLDTAAGRYEASRALRESSGDDAGLAQSFNFLGEVARKRGRFDEAQRCYDQSIDAGRRAGDARVVAISHNNIGVLALDRGEGAAANAAFGDALDTARRIGDERTVALLLANLGEVARRLEHDTARAHALFTESLAWRERLGDVRGVAESTFNLGVVAFEREEFDSSRQCFDEVRHLAADLGDRNLESRAFAALGEVLGRLTFSLAEEGKITDARETCVELVDLHRHYGGSVAAVPALRYLANLCERDGAPDEARALNEEASRLEDLIET